MRKNRCVMLCLMAVVLVGAPLFGQTGESLADKVSFELEFNASILSVDSEGVVDSMTDSGFNDDGTKIGLSYEDELWGASAALKFGSENLRFLDGEIGEMFGDFPLALDELYGWIKPFGDHFKFTGGIFENTDGLADYTDDIDDFSMGVFIFGEGGGAFAEPEATTDAALTNGFLSEAAFGPVTLQLLLAPNYSKESASDLVNSLFGLPYEEDTDGDGVPDMTVMPAVDSDQRFFRIGGRVIADVGVGTVSALYKVFQWPMSIVNTANTAFGDPAAYPGSSLTFNTFGAYFDFTAVENLGVSLGYTGFLPVSDASDVDNVLYSGIDLRATWTGIEGLSLSTHHNISFAQGAEKNWLGNLGKDASFLTLYNAIGVTKELTEKFSVNAVISNVFSQTDDGNSGGLKFENLVAGAKLITKINENAEFNVGLNVDFSNAVLSGNFGDTDDSLTVFSVPVGIKVSL